MTISSYPLLGRKRGSKFNGLCFYKIGFVLFKELPSDLLLVFVVSVAIGNCPVSESSPVIPRGDLSGAMCSSLDSRLKVELLGFANVTATVKLGAL